MIATLIGSTGLTGTFLLQHLLADPAITRIISISRRAPAIQDARLDTLLIDDLMSLSSIASRMRGDLYFCCLGTTIRAAGSRENFAKVDHAAVLAFARIASAHDARSLSLVSAMGADAQSRIFYNRVKGKVEDDVKALGLRSLNIFRPGLLTGPRNEFRLGEKLATALLLPASRLMPASLRKSLITPADTLARHMLVAGKAAADGVHVVPAAGI